MHWIDPDHLPASTHRIGQFLLNQHGEVDGFMSADGRQVHIPPHLGMALTKAARVGDEVRVSGIKPRDADLLVAVAIDLPGGKRLLDQGPPGKPPRLNRITPREREVEGEVLCALHAPRGECVGILLTHGLAIRFDPAMAQELIEFQAPGTRIHASGALFTTKWGSVLDADYLWHAEEGEGEEQGVRV